MLSSVHLIGFGTPLPILVPPSVRGVFCGIAAGVTRSYQCCVSIRVVADFYAVYVGQVTSREVDQFHLGVSCDLADAAEYFTGFGPSRDACLARPAETSSCGLVSHSGVFSVKTSHIFDHLTRKINKN
jgi:hypothetical protein